MIKLFEEFINEAVNNCLTDLEVTKDFFLANVDSLKSILDTDGSHLDDDIVEFLKGVTGGDKEMEKIFVKNDSVYIPKGTLLYYIGKYEGKHFDFETWDVEYNGKSYGRIIINSEDDLEDISKSVKKL